MHRQPCVLGRYATPLKSIWVVVAAICAALLVTGLLFKEHHIRLPLSPALFQTSSSTGASTTAQPAVTIVVASESGDDTTWLEPFNDWTKAVYITDNASASLTVPRNKGREGMAYLTYILDHYDHLPEIVIFSHSKRYQWHNDDPLYDGQAVLSWLNLTYAKSQGYVSLRCGWSLGCPKEIQPFVEAEMPPPASNPTAKDARAGAFYRQAFEHLFPETSVPDVVAAPCCAQFVVTAEQIRKRSKADYKRIRDWLLATTLNDALSGRILEYMWHIIFGQQAISCPVAGDCYCNLFNLCKLDCESSGTCREAYTLPKYSTMPDGWPDFDMDDNWQNVTEIRLKFEADNRGAAPADRT
ncbi:hypothetical protein Slin14017_G101150 [Septoria linicola]|nr:hypothetical protein Slin14017_G101150 [Septoria linicola]